MEAGALTVDDFLNFNLDVEENKENTQKAPTTPSNDAPDYTQGLALPEFGEEELEWLSNKDAFPSVESCLDILSETPNIILNHHSPVSVLDSINISNTNNIKNGNNSCRALATIPVRYPMKARSTSRLRRRRSCFPDPPTQHFVLWGQENTQRKQQQQQHQQSSDAVATGRKCTHCQVDKTPQWRAGPMGPKTLCNACGVRYKSGRLVPEYRPANSPTFSSSLHSNSHRKVVEMRKQKLLSGVAMNEPCAYSSVA